MTKKILIIKNKKFSDSRGYFKELSREKEINIKKSIYVMSFSKKNVIRGLHFQKPPFAQAKLVLF